MQTQIRETACSPLHPFFPWTRAINPVMQRASLWCKCDRDRPFIINSCICCNIILQAERDPSFWYLPHQTLLLICPRAQILLWMPHRFISASPPFKFDWFQGTAHCTHKTCQARIIQPTPTSPTSTSLHGSSFTASHKIMSFLPNSSRLANICVWRISISLSPTTSRLCLGMKIIL